MAGGLAVAAFAVEGVPAAASVTPLIASAVSMRRMDVFTMVPCLSRGPFLRSRRAQVVAADWGRAAAAIAAKQGIVESGGSARRERIRDVQHGGDQLADAGKSRCGGR